MKLFTGKQLYEADKATQNKEQITPIDIMERAANQSFDWLDQRLQGAQVPIHVFCGIGNNGGDGMALGRMLLAKGYLVKCYVVNYSDKRSKCFLINYDRYKNSTKNWPLLMNTDTALPVIHRNDIVIDCMFGIGLNKPIVPWVKEVIKHINKSQAFVLSIDMPSGLFVDKPTPDKEAVIKSTATLTFQAPKLVFFLPETNQFSQTIEVLNIGLDAEYLSETPTEAKLIVKNDILPMYQPRNKFSHKGDFGHCYIVGGSYGKIGSVSLAVKACLKAGAGKVSALVPKCGYSILQSTIPEAMVETSEEDVFLDTIEIPEEASAVGIGVGLGTHEKTAGAFLKFLKTQKKPMVIDADAINILAARPDDLKFVPKLSVLTPHPLELQRLIGNWKNDFEKLEKTKKFSELHDVIVVIKGAHTITVYKNNLFVNTSGNPGMATAGTGDVLTGILTGLLSQNYQPVIAAIFGVYLHGSAGDLAVLQTGYQSLLAGDLVDFIGDAYLDLFKKDDELPS